MAGEGSDVPSHEEAKDLDVSSPYEDYSDMMKIFNPDSDSLQPLSSSLICDSNHAVAKPMVNPQQCNTSKDIKDIVRINDAKFAIVGASNPLDCGRCEILREVMHINGLFITELSIHGQLGFFYHATLNIYHNIGGIPQAAEKSYINLKDRDLDWVKQFLLEYGAIRRRENFNVLNDWISPIYAVASSRTNLNDEPEYAPGSYLNSYVSPAITPQTRTDQSGCQQMKNEDQNSLFHVDEFSGSTSNIEAKSERTNPNSPNSECTNTECPLREVKNKQFKTPFAKQRERTAKMQLEEIAKYFHIPLTEAAKELQICTSSLKAICRRNGIARWPQRKIKAMDTRILNLKRELIFHPGGSKGAKRIETKIRLLKKTRTDICSGKGD